MTVDKRADPVFRVSALACPGAADPTWFPGFRALARGGWLVTRVCFLHTVISGVPVVATPAGIDVTAADLGAVGLESAR